MNVKLTPRKYILQGHTPVEVADLLTWAYWMETANRHVAKTDIAHVYISTVFLGLDQGNGNGNPVLFETMIFGGPLDGMQLRYHTWEEAEIGHQETVERVHESLT